MPKACDIDEKYINGILVDKENDDCFFNDASHIYYDKKTMDRYTSVTTMIHAYTQPFDAIFWSTYKALEALLDDDTFFQIKGTLLTKKKIDYNWLFSQINIDKFLLEYKIKEILNSYDKVRDDSCVIGSAIHLEKELSLLASIIVKNLKEEELRSQIEFFNKYMRLDKVYIEPFRGGCYASEEQLRKCKEIFNRWKQG